MDRSKYVGGSDAKRILEGDWLTLYQEKIGLKPEEDLTHQFNVQLGIHTEQFHIAWLNKYEGFDIKPAPMRRRLAHSDHADGFMAANLDGWCLVHDTFVEVKHSRGGANQDGMIEWYQPQMAHYCNVVGREYGYLSYIAGNTAPQYFKMQPSQHYRESLADLERAFWWHVETRTPPDKLPDTLISITKAARQEVKVDDMRSVDMTGNNKWATLVADYQINKDAAGQFEAAKKGLKELVEPDVGKASGHGITIKRSKSNSLLFSEG